jgi:hypothetical protein
VSKEVVEIKDQGEKEEQKLEPPEDTEVSKGASDQDMV